MKTSSVIAGLALVSVPLALLPAACDASKGSTATTGSSTTSTGSGGASNATATNGSTNATGTASTGNATSSTSTGGTEPCPPAEPVAGAACPGATITACTYKPYACCPEDTATCPGATWSVTEGMCPATTCPATAPNNGDACGCPFAKVCLYTAACANANGMEQFAVCTNGKWAVNSGACQKATPIPCGAAMCTAGTEVCVRIGTGTEVGCAPNRCPMNAIDCSCAHTVCPAAHPICTGSDGPFVNCE